ncbi:hypothetical protein GCM10012279_22820 [Micromonospora yangpuensis]|nr:hypothetical protein GCM10012279_22820 [Micromonospora yangpuensis]
MQLANRVGRGRCGWSLHDVAKDRQPGPVPPVGYRFGVTEPPAIGTADVTEPPAIGTADVAEPPAIGAADVAEPPAVGRASTSSAV